MPPPRRKVHELRPVRRANSAYVWYGRRWVPLGPWDVRRDQPSDAAEEQLARLKALWRVDPLAGVVRADDPLLFAVWNDWRAAPHAPPDRRGELGRCERELFGTPDAPGPHAATLASAFGPPELLAWQDWLCGLTAGEGDRKRLSRYTVGEYVSLVRRCFKWAVAKGLVDRGHAASLADVPPPPEHATRKATRRVGVAWERVEAVCAKLRSRACADFVHVLWLCGARPSELARVTVGMVQKTGQVRPEKGAPVTLGRCWAAYLGRQSKTGEERCLFFGPRCQEVLAPYLDGREPGELLFTTSRGGAFTAKLLTQSVKRACGAEKGRRGEERRNGEPKGEAWTVYQLRHAAAERVQAEFGDFGWLAAQAFLGHRVKGVTSTYTGPNLTLAAAVAAKLG